MERNLTIIGICAFLAFIGYTYVDNAKNTNTLADNKYDTKIEIEKYDLFLIKEMKTISVLIQCLQL